MKIVEVAVGVIVRDNHIFICKRANHQHQGGKWEFPGGKRESNETIEQALTRELKEEIGILVTVQTPLMLIEHDYGDKKVKLDVRVVSQFEGEPTGLEGQESRWVNKGQIAEVDFPEANQAIVKQLML